MKAGSTSQIVQIQINDSTTGAGKTGLAFDTSGLLAYYIRNTGSSSQAITLLTMTLGTWVSGGFKEVDATHIPGLYQVGIPNVALAAGATEVDINFSGVSGCIYTPLKITLEATIAADLPLASDIKTAIEATGSSLALIKAKTDVLPSATAGAVSGLVINDAANAYTPKSIYDIVNNATYGNSALHTEVAKDATVSKDATVNKIAPATPTNVVDAAVAVISAISALNNLSQADIRTAIGLSSANLAALLAALKVAVGNDPNAGISHDFTVLDSSSLPIADVLVEAKQSGATVQSTRTGDDGIAHFDLPAGTYDFYSTKSGWNFTNPVTETVS